MSRPKLPGNGRRCRFMLCAALTKGACPPVPSPNAFAYLMICLWPILAWQMWLRMDAGRALVWTILGGYLILPPLTAINLPVVPDLNKESIPNLVSLAFVLVVLRHRVTVDPGTWPGRVLIGLFVLSPFATVLTNPDPIPIEAGDIQGLAIYDSVAAVANQAIALIPFFLARRYLADPAAMRAVLVALVLAGFAYSVPMIIETRLSPQMNVWVYGFFQHDFFQTIRFGGYRPVVFLQHGLWVAFFALMTFAAALALLRAGPAPLRPGLLLAVGYTAGLVVLSKSAGPTVYALGLAPWLLFAPRHWQVGLAAVLGVMVMAYPLLRGAGLVPLEDIVALARSISAERAESLAFRVQNEELLLNRAAERIWFGWGGYARGLIHDPVTGRVQTIADGLWVITMGARGWTGYVAEFGLLVVPLLMLAREAWARGGAMRLSPYAAALALILAVNAVDLLPNATLIPFTWLLAGAVFGSAEAMRAARRAEPGPLARRPVRTVI